MILDLSKPQHRQDLADQIQIDIEEFCATHYDSGHRKHLGASLMGDECWRKLWYSFRWAKKEVHDGRVLRLFNVGHMAEPRFITYLRGIGFEVKEFAEDGKQFRISGCNGHYGGSLDGMAKAPSHYNLPDDLIFLTEYKTNGTGAGFANVATQELYKSKPTHFAQMCQYGFHYKLRYGLYMIENKHDSSIIIKIVELDWSIGEKMQQKADEIINSKEPPPRISDNPATFNCKFCNFAGICHGDQQVEKNCRSCRQCTPVANGEWHCSNFNAIVPDDFLPNGCNNWLPI